MHVWLHILTNLNWEDIVNPFLLIWKLISLYLEYIVDSSTNPCIHLIPYGQTSGIFTRNLRPTLPEPSLSFRDRAAKRALYLPEKIRLFILFFFRAMPFYLRNSTRSFERIQRVGWWLDEQRVQCFRSWNTVLGLWTLLFSHHILRQKEWTIRSTNLTILYITVSGCMGLKLVSMCNRKKGSDLLN